MLYCTNLETHIPSNHLVSLDKIADANGMLTVELFLMLPDTLLASLSVKGAFVVPLL